MLHNLLFFSATRIVYTNQPKSSKINKKQSILFEKHMYFCIDLIHGIFLYCSIRQDRKIQNYVYWRETLRIKNLFFITLIICTPYVSMSSEQIASTKYVENIVNSIRTDSITSESTNIQIPSAKAVWQLNATISNSLTQHTSNTANPHSVSAAQVGLGNVKNIDTTNANNISSGTVSYARLPIGTNANTVAAGNDVRFNTVSTTKPEGTPPSGTVWIWFEK